MLVGFQKNKGEKYYNISLGSRYEYHDYRFYKTIYHTSDGLPSLIFFDPLNPIESYNKLKNKIQLLKTFQ